MRIPIHDGQRPVNTFSKRTAAAKSKNNPRNTSTNRNLAIMVAMWKHTMTATVTILQSAARSSVLLFQLLSILQMPIQTDGNVFRVVPICEAGCYCFGAEGNCPSYPSISENTLPTYRELDHANPMNILSECDPFLSSTCVPSLEQGEACVVDLIPSNTTEEASCPSGFSYRLRTVPSLDDAIAGGQYITHVGACGTCSSLQDLALMIEYPNIPYRAHQCFFRSNALTFIEEAISCYQEIGFSLACSSTLAYHQKRIVDRNCGYQCAAWGYDGDLGRPSCQDVSGCGACVDELGISARLELIAGRTFANSGYPSQKAQQCSDIAPVEVIGGSDICNEAPLAKSPTTAPSTAPSIAPVVPTTASPTTASPTTRSPTVEPTPLPTAVPTGIPTASPVEPTKSPTNIVTAAPVAITTASPTPAPIQLPTFSLSYQQCLSTAAIEVRAGAMAGGNGVVCDCSDAQTGATNRPRCYSSPDRNESSQCGILYDRCGSGPDCCGNGVRSCRGGSCRLSARKTDKNNLRLSGSRGGANRDRSTSITSSVNGDGETRRRGRVRGRE